MKVCIKKFDVDMEIKNNGIELEVYDAEGKEHVGDLVITKRKLIWCAGKTDRENGFSIEWEKFISFMKRK